MAECNSKGDAVMLTKEDIQALQKHLFSMYKDIERICDRHELTVTLAFGNVIGVMRHGGWIPWDDDLDLYMPRKDYDIFLKEYVKELPEKYIVYSLESAAGPIVRFTKIIDKTTVFSNPTEMGPPHVEGVFIDIFPLDDVPSSMALHKIKKFLSYGTVFIQNSVMQYKYASEEYKNILCSTSSGKRLFGLRKVVGAFCSPIGLKNWFRLLDLIISNKREGDYVYCGISTQKGWNPMPKDYVFPPRKFRFPNGEEAYIPHQSEKYLAEVYGDWKKIPDDKDKWHHYCKDFRLPKESDQC